MNILVPCYGVAGPLRFPDMTDECEQITLGIFSDKDGLEEDEPSALDLFSVPSF